MATFANLIKPVIDQPDEQPALACLRPIDIFRGRASRQYFMQIRCALILNAQILPGNDPAFSNRASNGAQNIVQLTQPASYPDVIQCRVIQEGRHMACQNL